MNNSIEKTKDSAVKFLVIGFLFLAIIGFSDMIIQVATKGKIRILSSLINNK